MNDTRTIRVETKVDTKKAHEWREAMTAISRATNTVPVTRIEWLIVAFIASQTIGNVGSMLIAIALLRGHP